MILCVCPNPSVDTLVCVDRITPGAIHRVLVQEQFPGGKGVHVALAAAKLGGAVTLAGVWGGPTGRWIRDQCTQQGVTCVGPEIDGWTRQCLTFQAPAPFDQTEFRGSGPPITEPDADALDDCVRASLKDTSVLTLSGSWPPCAAVNAYARMIQWAKDVNVPALLDATAPMLDQALQAHPFGVHLNRQEARAALGPDDPVQAVRALAGHCELAVVTAGDQGAYLGMAGEFWHTRCVIVPQYGAVGSGDCLLAGMAVAMTRGLSIQDLAAMACACGAANCLRPELGMLRRTDVEQLIPQVHVRRLP